MSASGLQVPQLLAQSSDFRLGGLTGCGLAPDRRILPVIVEALAGVRIVQPELQVWFHAEVKSQHRAATRQPPRGFLDHRHGLVLSFIQSLAHQCRCETCSRRVNLQYSRTPMAA